ncbi:Oxidoreductase sirO [Lachnellula suecica]|uniref:Oxidoreductase sirO n=1 Tax=Lachnellula suecica TaxID=602035 RepID=A0A8T9C679_9HELO|nr:Oxidoreductase sirO [Lachnellula suecica]
MPQGLNLIFGATRVGNAGWNGIPEKYANDEATFATFKILKKHNIKHLDTGRLYGKSEAALGRYKAGTELGFIIDTKWVGGFFDPSSTTKERIIVDAKDSLAKLGILKIHCFSLHSPNMKPGIEDTLDGVNEVYKTGAFEHFGLSNFTTAQVREVYDICKAKAFVLPTVYQGLYNPVNRKQEEELLPLLRKLGIAFNAYSPLAGGFLVKSHFDVTNNEGRFNKDTFGGLYNEMYNNGPYLVAHAEWGRIAKEESITRAALAYRWMNFHSALKTEFGDGMLLGGRLPQLEEAFEALDQGPLSDSATESIQKLWEKLQPHVKYAHNLEAQIAVMVAASRS